MKDSYCSYYTHSDEITEYMISQIGNLNGDVILEPSAGDGIFLDGILSKYPKARIDAYEINPSAVDLLKQKYKSKKNIKVVHSDTLFDAMLDKYSIDGGYYDKVIGNPPYGAWLDYDMRKKLKAKYDGHYARESYSLFIIRCLNVLKNKGKMCFIVPDTYLFLNMFKKLRELLFSTTKINEILIFPSKFFPGIKFGYSNLSIISFEKCIDEKEALNNTFRVIKGFKSSKQFENIEDELKSKKINQYLLKQKDIMATQTKNLVFGDKESTKKINESKIKIGDVADVVTGFYTGDNKKFIKVLNKSVRGAKNYSTVDESNVFRSSSINGVKEKKEAYIPYIKSSSNFKYKRSKDEWFVRWDEKTIDFYNSNKKSRFQNSKFYFKTGIGMPMVKSSNINAFLIEGKLFDQSIVGIFPRDKSKINYLLALMNSKIINETLHIINPTANNSANYVKLLPYVEPDKIMMKKISSLVNEILSKNINKEYDSVLNIHEKLNGLISEIYNQDLH